jgi:hypothetical protein
LQFLFFFSAVISQKILQFFYRESRPRKRWLLWHIKRLLVFIWFALLANLWMLCGLPAEAEKKFGKNRFLLPFHLQIIFSGWFFESQFFSTVIRDTVPHNR